MNLLKRRLLSSGLYRRLWICTKSANDTGHWLAGLLNTQRVEFTAGGELRPALKRCAKIIALFFVKNHPFYRMIRTINSSLFAIA